MKILGNRVYLLMPTLPERKIDISPELEKQLKEEMDIKFDRMTVYDVGQTNGAEAVKSEPLINPGDEVFVDPNSLKRGVILKIDGKDVICVMGYEIMHVW